MTDPRKPARAYEEAPQPTEPEAPEEALFAARTDVGAPEVPAPAETPPETEPLAEPESVVAVETEAQPAPEPDPVAEPEPEPLLAAAQPEPLFTPDPVVAPEPEPEPVEDAHFDHGPEPWEHVPPPAPKAPPRPVAPVAVAAAPAAPAQPVRTEAQGRDYGAGAPPEAFATGEASPETKKIPFAVYLLYLTSLMLVAPAGLGVWLAYQSRAEAPEWLKSHYQFQIRTFWVAVVVAVAAAGLASFGIGLLGVLALVLAIVWVTLRCFVGMVRLHRGEPIYHPQTWTV